MYQIVYHNTHPLNCYYFYVYVNNDYLACFNEMFFGESKM